MKNKILLCDANFCVLPIVKAIKTEDRHITVLGAKLDDPAHNIADTSVYIDYSNIELLYKHISKNNYDAIIPGCNDRSYMSLAYVAEKMDFDGFDSYETVLTIHHKDRFRVFAEKKNYPMPKAITMLEDINKLNFPVLVKPVDSFSGKGINKAYSIEELHIFWKEAEAFSSSGLVVVEEFVEGELYSHSAFIKNGKIIVDFFVNEYCTIYPYQVNSSNISMKLNKKVKKLVQSWTEQFAKDLDLCDGLIHTQFISDNQNFSLIEIARRCPGDLYSQLIQKSTGIDYAKLYAMPFCGIELPDKIEKPNMKYISRHTVSTDKKCIFISASLDINNVNIQNVQLKYSGEEMEAAPFDKSGIYFIEFHDIDTMEDMTKKLKDFTTIETLNMLEKGTEYA